MKQLKIFAGGHPYDLDDIEHVQDGMVEATIALMKGLLTNGATIPNCILYGCVSSGAGPFSISAGAVILDGEICMFAGASGLPYLVVGGSGYLVLTPTDTYPASNPVAYATVGLTHNVHLNRIATATYTSSPASNQYIYGNDKKFKDVLKTNLFPGVFTLNYIGAAGQPAYVNGFSNGYPGSGTTNLRFIKDVAGNVRLGGAIDYSPLDAGPYTYPGLQVCQALPVGSRPDRDITTVITAQLPGGYVTLQLTIQPNGILYAMAIGFVGGVSDPDISSGSPFGVYFEANYTAV